MCDGRDKKSNGSSKYRSRVIVWPQFMKILKLYQEKRNISLKKRDSSRRNSNRYLALFQVLNWSWAQVSNELLLCWVIKRDELVRIYFRITWYSVRKSTAQARASKTKLTHCSWAVCKALTKAQFERIRRSPKDFRKWHQSNRYQA